jgi:hypothetical protein
MADVPFPESLCHRCDAPPRYVRTARSVFILCPRLAVKYPAQPVLSCPAFHPLPLGEARGEASLPPPDGQPGQAPARRPCGG